MDLRNDDMEASSSMESTGSCEIMMTDTGAEPSRGRVSWYTMSVEPLLSRTSTSSRITTSPRWLFTRCWDRIRAMSSGEKPLSGNPLS